MSEPVGGNHRGNGSLPWWVRAVSIVGIPAALAGYLIWWLTSASFEEHRALHREVAATRWNAYYICRFTAPDLNRANQCISPFGGAAPHPETP